MNKDSSLLLKKSDNSDVDIEDLLGQKQKLESLIKKKFTKEITVMFTDLSGSTRLSAELGDLAMRSMIQDHNNIVFPIIEAFSGVLVKTMGDGTMSYFNNAVDAVKAAEEIQLKFSEHNKLHDPPLLIRCGLNTGKGIVEKNDVFGDVVNVAQRFETLAKPMEILLSNETYELVKSLEDLYVVYVTQAKLRGKDKPQNIYKLVWDPDEVELYKLAPTDSKGKNRITTISGAISTNLSTAAAKTESGVQRNLLLARLKVQRANEPPTYYTLGADDVIVGRSSKSQVSLPDAYVSRRHLKIFTKGNKFYAEDLRSNIGTVIRGEKLSVIELDDGDEMIIGGIRLIFERITRDDSPSDITDNNEDMVDTMALSLGAQSLQLLVEDKGKIVSHYTIEDKPLLIGRTDGCDIKLPGRTISRLHSKVYKKDNKLCLEDLKSNNGTFVNGSKVVETDLAPGDEIVIGHYVLRLADYDSISEEADVKPERFAQKVLSFLKKKNN